MREKHNLTIEVTKTPTGDAPKYVRKALVGLRLPAIKIEPPIPLGAFTFIGSGLKSEDGFVVMAEDTIKALKGLDRYGAAEWFKETIKALGGGMPALALCRCEAKIYKPFSLLKLGTSS